MMKHKYTFAALAAFSVAVAAVAADEGSIKALLDEYVEKGLVAGVVSGMKEFKAKYARAKPYLIGGQGMPPEMFFSREADEFF